MSICTINDNLHTDIDMLGERIENRRLKLNRMIEENENQILKSEIINLSQELDELIIKYISYSEGNRFKADTASA